MSRIGDYVIAQQELVDALSAQQAQADALNTILSSIRIEKEKAYKLALEASHLVVDLNTIADYESMPLEAVAVIKYAAEFIKRKYLGADDIDEEMKSANSFFSGQQLVDKESILGDGQ